MTDLTDKSFDISTFDWSFSERVNLVNVKKVREIDITCD